MPDQQSMSPTLSVAVTVTGDPTGGKFNTICNPDSVTVTVPNTTIAYNIVSSSPAGITFTGLTVRGPDTKQLGAPTIGNNGTTISVDDINTVAGTLHVTLQFKTAEGRLFTHDPQVQNEPP